VHRVCDANGSTMGERDDFLKLRVGCVDDNLPIKMSEPTSHYCCKNRWIMLDNEASYAEQELLYNRFMEPALRSAIHHLALPSGSIGLDAGCGAGGVLHLLDAATGGMGYIFGTDISPALLMLAQQALPSQNVRGGVSLFCADLGQPLPLPDDCVDWVWT